MPETTTAKPSGLAIEQYLGIWSIAPNHMPSTLPAPVMAGNARDIVQETLAFDGAGFSQKRNIALIDIRGVMSKYGSFFSNAGSTVIARRKISAAAADPTVDGILLIVESPGGSVAGNLDLAKEVAAARDRKPVGAFIEDLGASAAYEVASQASFISTTESSVVGSIGTFAVVYDFSEYLGSLGIKTILIKAGDFKGMGVLGTELTEQQQAEIQRMVDTMNGQFIDAVATGRGITAEEATALADGRVHVGKDALAVGLVDHIESLESAFSRLLNLSSERKGEVMAEEKTSVQTESQPKAATLTELKACCPGASADFLMAQLEAGASKQEAQTAFILKQQNDLQQRQAELESSRRDQADAEQRAAHAAIKPQGNAPIIGSAKNTEESESDPVQEFEQAIADNIAKGMDRCDAAVEADLKYPGLRDAYLAARKVNPRSTATKTYRDAQTA